MESHGFSSLKDIMKTPSSSSCSWSSENGLETPRKSISLTDKQITKSSPCSFILSSSSPPSPPASVSSETKMIQQTSASVEKRFISNGGRLFPPPITCLRTIKKGKPYAFLRFNESDNNFVVEKIRIPQREILRACRKDGRLKLYFVQSDDECSDAEEEGEAAVATKEEGKEKI